MIPMLREVIAGIPIEAIKDIINWEKISKTMANSDDYFALSIKGDSMTPRITESDIVTVRQQHNAKTEEIVIAKINGKYACCKRLIKGENGLTLQSLNPMYEPMYFSKEEVRTMPVSIIGKVVELRGRF